MDNAEPQEEMAYQAAGMSGILPGKTALAGLACALVVGALLRLGYLAVLMQAPDFAAPVLDPQFNDYWARAIVTGDWTPPAHAADPRVRATPYGRPPGYPYALAAVYAAAGLDYLAPRLVQMALGLVNIVLAWWLARRLFGGGAAAVTGLGMAVYWPFIYFEGELNGPVFVTMLALLFALALVQWLWRPRFWWAGAAGLALGALALFRPNALLLWPAVLLWLGWLVWRGHHGARRAAAAALVLTVGWLLGVAPVIVRNYAVSGEFVFISCYGGINAYIGNNPESTGDSAELPQLTALTGMEGWNCFNYPRLVERLAARRGEAPSFSATSEYFYGRALDFVVSQPLDAARLTLRKALLFWGPATVSDSKEVALERASRPPLPWLPGFPVAAAFGMLGFALCVWRGQHLSVPLFPSFPRAAWECIAGAGLLFLCVFSYFLSVLPFFVAERYRIPVAALLIPLGGYGAAALFALLKRRQYGRLVRWFSVAAALLVWFHLPWAPYTPDTSRWHLHHALAWAQQGDRAAARAELERAIAAGPDNSAAHLRLGYLLAAEGDRQGARHHYRAAVRTNPDSALAHNNLGYELAQAGRLNEAEDAYRAALEISPDFALAQNNLGNLLLDRGRAADAERVFRGLTQTHPDDPHAWYNLGNALRVQGRLAAAVSAYERALQRTPGNPDVHNNLGLTLSLLGRYEEAIARLRRAIELAPGHAKAHFNLGNAYGQTGQLDHAAHHLGKALDLAPDFSAARENLDQVNELRIAE